MYIHTYNLFCFIHYYQTVYEDKLACQNLATPV